METAGRMPMDGGAPAQIAVVATVTLELFAAGIYWNPVIDAKRMYPMTPLLKKLQELSRTSNPPYRIVGIAWGGRGPVRRLSIRLNPDAAFAPVEEIGGGDGRTWSLWSHRFPAPAPGRYRIELAVKALIHVLRAQLAAADASEV